MAAFSERKWGGPGSSPGLRQMGWRGKIGGEERGVRPVEKGKRLRLARGEKTLPTWAWYALCFVLPALTLTWAYAMEGFYPFGDKSVLVSDMAQQYVEFFCALKKGGLFFNWSKALGTSYIGVFSFYVSSPLSFLTLLVPNQVMPLGVMALVVLKLGLAGLSYGVFSKGYFGRSDLGAALGAVCYGLCAYAVGYSLDIMWLDGLIWLPIVLLGLERLLEGRTRWLFPVSLAVCFVSTWYISYMIGGFCLLWFLARVYIKGLDSPTALRRLGDFLLSALWALCLTAWLWLPTFLAMGDGKFSTALMDYGGLFNFDLPRLFPQFLFGQHQYFTNAALPNVFCGTATFLAAIGYFFLKNRPRRERAAFAALLGALLLSLWLSPLDKVWHLFQYPNWFPYRYAFLVSFLLVFLAQHTVGHIKEKASLPRWAAFALAVLLCVEMGANARVIFQTIDRAEPYQAYSVYQEDYRRNAELVARAKADAPAGSFYRMGATYDRGLNSPLAFGYNGVTHYSSLYNAQLNGALRALGLAQNWYWCAYYGSSHFTDALFGVRYVITDRAVPGYERVAQADGLGLYENPNALPLAFVAVAPPNTLAGSPVERQNRLFADLTGEVAPLFTPIQPQTETYDGWVSLTYTGTGRPIYLDLTDGVVTDLQMGGKSLFRYPSHTGKTRSLHCLGAPEAGERLTAIVTYNGGWDSAGKSYTCDLEALSWGMAGLENTQVDVSGARVTVTARSVTATGTLVTTIPAEEGWRAYVDGKRVGLSSWLEETFLAVALPAGEHQVRLCYTPPGLPLGLGLGAVALVWAGALWWLQKRKKA